MFPLPNSGKLQEARTAQATPGRERALSPFPSIFVLDQGRTIRFEDVRGPDLDKAVESLVGEAIPRVSRCHDPYCAALG